MGFWSFYFFAKIGAFCAGFIGLHVGLNLVFALYTALPVQRRALRIAKQLIAVPLGLALAYHDSWLPPWQRIVAQWGQLKDFSFAYLLDLGTRFINPQLVLALFLLLLVYWLLSRKLRLSTFAFIALFLAPWLGTLTGAVKPVVPVLASASGAPNIGVAEQSPDAALAAFYAQAQQRKLHVMKPADNDLPFDIILLQICSLAWDDLSYVGAREHALLNHFDVRFDNFSSAASYSGPAAIRLLRSACGQSPHDKLYDPAPPECYLMDQLRSAGFQPQWAMNHDGVYGDMRTDIADRGHVDATLFPLAGFQAVLRSFSGDPYYRDYDVLSAWWKQRVASGVPRVALYYNTGTLHDGNRFLDGSRPDVKDSYRRRVQTLFGDIDHFLADLSASGRRAVVVMVPEHGANVRGDRLQISGLREIPSPAIALIPVGVRLIGLPQVPTIAVSQPTSLYGLSSLLADFIDSDPYDAGAPALSDYVRAIPETQFVAENAGTIVMRYDGRYLMRGNDHQWTEYQP